MPDGSIVATICVMGRILHGHGVAKVIKMREHIQKRLSKPSTSSPHGINRNETQCEGSTRGRIAASRLQAAGSRIGGRIRSGAHNSDLGIIRGQQPLPNDALEVGTLGHLNVEHSVGTWLQFPPRSTPKTDTKPRCSTPTPRNKWNTLQLCDCKPRWLSARYNSLAGS